MWNAVRRALGLAGSALAALGRSVLGVPDQRFGYRAARDRHIPPEITSG